MLFQMLQAKLHRVRVTEANLNYEGSCGIDENLLDAARLRPFQKIDIYNVSNGERFSTYIIKAPRGSGEISLNGAAARRVMVDDLLIICGYSLFNEADLEHYQPVVVFVDEANRPSSVSLLETAQEAEAPIQ
jgi:aspartate 1-decarboxylase